jgi:hypothetical protein
MLHRVEATKWRPATCGGGGAVTYNGATSCGWPQQRLAARGLIGASSAEAS